ncbi:MAG: hypothetical protein WC179_08285 [Candidatus Cloacimonadaceae bacterium]|nr:hypothetical protein [Bacteroidales bacterium]
MLGTLNLCHIIHQPLQLHVNNAVINLCLIEIVLISVFGYLLFTGRAKEAMFDMMGSGDFLLLFCLSLGLSPVIFFGVLLFSAVISLLNILLLKLADTKSPNYINSAVSAPFAGIAALLYAVSLIHEVFFHSFLYG